MHEKSADLPPEPTEFNVILEPHAAARAYRAVRVGWLRVIPKLDPECERQLRAVLLAFRPEAAPAFDEPDDVTPFIVEAGPRSV